MPLPERQAHWEHVYATKADDEVSWFQPRPSTSVELIHRTGGGKGASIIDVGGGASRLVDALLDEGYGRIAVLDVAETALARARKRLGERASGVKWIAADVTSWTPRNAFDVWHDRALFHFLTEARDREAYRRTLAAALPEGGHAIVGTFAADGPERCSGLPVVRYAPAALAAEMGPEWQLSETLSEDHATPGGKIQRFQFSRFVRLR
jgi:SAM-dependent methyltransferase